MEKNNNQCYICIVNELLIKKSIKNIRLIDINNKIISSYNPLEIGKKIKLACDPFKNFGRCSVIKNNTYYLVEFLPSVNIIISTLTPIINASDIEKDIINILKTYPKIIIFKNHKIIKGKFDLNHFYIIDVFKPLNIFIGMGINYNELDEIINTYIKNIEKSTYQYFTYFIFTYLLLILLIYMFMFVFLKSRLDIVEKAFNEYRQKARFDKLTNLYNREGFEIEYKKAKYDTLLILDLDNFKYINDTFGHEKGDEILKEFAWQLNKYFKEDLIGRWGGDEFLVATNKDKKLIKEIVEKFNCILQKIQEKFDKSKLKKLSLSVGGANNSITFEEKFKRADLALYKVKKLGKKGCLFYDEIDYIKIEKKDLNK